MPRFLNTWTGEFEWHPDPTQVTYAILSHVWREPQEGGEQSYAEVRRIQQEVKEDRWIPAALDSDASICSDTSMAWAPFAFISFQDIEYEAYPTVFAHPELSNKIKGFCTVAREAGFHLAWNDVCCIDQTSSAELSEAINSMYEWYRLSDMCYVYLADVSDGDVPWELFKFRESKWHRRGWTLQELIAPERIVFLTETWNVLGTKIGLAKTLEKVTGVDFDILVGRALLDSVSVARRMSWAAKRETTRVEDRAYSLLGIFGLHMSPIYGEGENAFLRLQEEIIRTIPDQSIFAWGDGCTLRPSNEREWAMQECSWFGTNSDEHRSLLASSPTSFSHSSNIEPIASSSLAQTLRLQESQIPPVHCIFTPEGVSMRLVYLPLSGVPDIRKAFQGPQCAQDTCAKGRQRGEFDTIALLQCQERRETGTTSILGLPLFRSRPEGGGSNRCAFHIGGHIHDDNYSWSYHTVRLKIRVLMKVLKHVRPMVDDMTLLRHYSGPSIPKSLQRDDTLPHDGLISNVYDYLKNIATPYLSSGNSYVFDYLKDTAIQISPHTMEALRTLRIVPSPMKVTRSDQEIILGTTLAFHRNSRAGATDAIALQLSFTKRSRLDCIVNACLSVGGVGVFALGCGQSSSIGASAGASHHAVVSTPHIGGISVDLDSHNNSRTVIPLKVQNMMRCTIISAEYTVHSKKNWGGSKALLLRIALQNPFASLRTKNQPLLPLWLSIDISEEHPSMVCICDRQLRTRSLSIVW